MEISAVCVSKAVSSNFYPPFSDQSHLQFYGHGSSFLAPPKICFRIPCRHLLSVASKPLRALCDASCKAPMELTAEQALMKELADLKLQMKQRKKELKAHLKDDKKKLKIQAKEERKRKKQKAAEEGNTKRVCQSESSSSSSESSDEECSSVSMKTLRQGEYMLEDARLNGGGDSVLESCIASSAGVSSSFVSKDDPVEVGDGVFSSLSSDVMEGCAEKLFRAIPSSRESFETCLTLSSMGSSNGCTSIPKVISELEDVQNHASKCGMLSPCKSKVTGRSGPTSHVLSTLPASNRIEVCAGGKCKKAGSEQLLSALQGQIPGSSNVEAVPCKCMGKCSMTINVRVLKEDTNPQHHSHVGVEDGSLILSHHFRLGRPPAGLPSFLSPQDGPRAPFPLVTV